MQLSSNVQFFLESQMQLRILHWQTKGFARHKAFGETYENLDELIDEFVEVSMGKYGRFSLSDSEKTLNLKNITEVELGVFLKTMKGKLIEITSQLSSDKDTDLLNLRDEMLGLVNKLSYLLTLE